MKIKNKAVPLPKKQVVFWLIVFVCCAPVVLSAISYYFQTKSTVNYGYLLNPPVSVNELSLTEIKNPTIKRFDGPVTRVIKVGSYKFSG